MIYQHPLAYLLGLEGAALLRGWAGEYDRQFVDARLAEVRRLLANDSLVNHPGVLVRRGDASTAYREGSATYDDGRNSLYDYDEPFVYDILDALPKGTVLDAACGTGRYAEHAAADGHKVIGVEAAIPRGFDVRRCEEPRFVSRTPARPASPGASVEGWDDWPWSLMAMVPEAFRAGFGGLEDIPQTIVWHFELGVV